MNLTHSNGKNTHGGPQKPKVADRLRAEFGSNSASSTGKKNDERNGEDAGTAFRQSKGGYCTSTLAGVKELFRSLYYFEDDTAIDLVLGIVAGNHFDDDPLWLHIVSPPSAGKTELLFSLQRCPAAFFLSDFTPNALISGYKDPPNDNATAAACTEAKDYSLLPQLDGKVLVTKDFSIIHDKPAETRAQTLSILRDVYDGFASRALGNCDVKGFHSRFNYLTGMTPEIEKSWSLNTLGERFLIYRLHVPDRRRHARQALLNSLDPKRGVTTIRGRIQDAVAAYLARVPKIKPAVSGEMLEKIIDLADLLATARTYVWRDKNDDIPCLPQAELAARVAKQLMRIGRSVALVRCRKSVTADEFSLMKRVALDSIPTNRRHLLFVLWQNRANPEPLDTFTRAVSRISSSTVRRELENLSELGAVDRSSVQVSIELKKTIKTIRTHYRLSDKFLHICERVGGVAPPLTSSESGPKGGAA